MEVKTEKQFLFEVQLNWLADTKGILSARDAGGTVHVASSPRFGGKGKPWTPEHYFLSSVCSCFMTTYLAFSKKHQFSISDFECHATGQIEKVDGKYKFTTIDLYPRIYIADEASREKASVVLEKTYQYSLVTNSVNAGIVYHSEILTTPSATGEIKAGQVKTKYSTEDAKEIGLRLGIDFTKYDLQEFRRGLEVEMEHGKRIRETNVTNDNEYITGKIAWAHLHEIPDYYSRLDKMENEAKKAMIQVNQS